MTNCLLSPQSILWKQTVTSFYIFYEYMMILKKNEKKQKKTLFHYYISYFKITGIIKIHANSAFLHELQCIFEL